MMDKIFENNDNDKIYRKGTIHKTWQQKNNNNLISDTDNIRKECMRMQTTTATCEVNCQNLWDPGKKSAKEEVNTNGHPLDKSSPTSIVIGCNKLDDKKIVFDENHVMPDSSLSCQPNSGNHCSTSSLNSLDKLNDVPPCDDQEVTSSSHLPTVEDKLEAECNHCPTSNDDEDDECSDNSTANLSFHSENGFMDEFIILPSNFLSDDEVSSNSDDCVYAYRGANMDPPEPLREVLEDETDFLEMDFDPETNSELENYVEENPFRGLENEDFFNNRSENLSLINNEAINNENQIGKSSMTNLDGNAGLVNSNEIFKISNKENNIESNEIEIGDNYKNSNCDISSKTILNFIEEFLTPSNAANNENERTKVNRNTGTKPKTFKFDKLVPLEPPQTILTAITTNGDGKQRKLEINCDTTFNNAIVTRNRTNENLQLFLENENNCLDCSESEFLTSTIQTEAIRKICPKHNNLHTKQNTHTTNNPVNNHLVDSSSNTIENLNMISTQMKWKNYQPQKNTNDLHYPKNQGWTTKYQSHHHHNLHNTNNSYCDYYENRNSSTMLILDQPDSVENRVKIFSIQYDETSIVDSLNTIGIKPDLSVLKKYFDEQNTSLSNLNLPGYLLQISKQYCDYKKLMKTIKRACGNDQVDISFTAESASKTKRETIKVSSLEIIKRWYPNVDLREIAKVQNKHFHSMNILGKIVNILRQQDKIREIDKNNYINIPHYYCSGYIFITKKT